MQARAPGSNGNGITIVIDYATDNTLDVTVSGTTITIEVDDANTAGEIATAINSDEEANRLVTALVDLNDAVGTVASNAGNPVSVSNGGVLSGGAGSPLTGNVTGMSFGNFYGSASGTTAQRRLYGITDTGEFIRISTTTGAATRIPVTPALSTVTSANFQGLTLGPQNVAGGIYANLLFAIADDGTLVAINPATTTATLAMVFDSNGDGTFDATSINTGVNNATGLAFGGADINLWHPTTRVPVDSDGNPVTAGRGINAAFDFSRTPNRESVTVTDGQGNTTEYNHNEANGGVSFYFGIETYVPTGTSPYLNYEDSRSQLGIPNNDVHRDLSAVSGGGNNYNLPGGAAGSLVTAPFDLVSQFGNATAADRPVLYFNYFLETEGAEEGNPARASGGQMRDSARVYVTPDGGATWQLIATNNSARDDDSELPTYASISRFADAADGRQATQELFDNTDAWRQAVIDLSDYVGLTNLQLKFDFSTSGSRNDPTLLTGDGTPTDNFGEYQTEVNDTDRQPSADNDHQGWFIDDLIIGWAERGQMITGAAADRSFTQVPQDPDSTAPIEILSGPYQLEIRRGYEYGAQDNPTGSNIVLSDSAIPDTNARFIPGANLFPLGGGFTPRLRTNVDASSQNYFTGIVLGDLVPDGGITGFFDPAVATNINSSPTSALIGPNEQAILSTTVTTGDGFMTFERFFMPEVGHDTFQVFIDGTPIAGADFEYSGDDSVGGAFVVTSVPISAGSHTVRFIHKKGPGGTRGVGHLALDNIQFPAIGGYLRSDLNLKREQGIFEISGNTILAADLYGIDVEAGGRDAVTGFAHPGSPINFETQNLVGLAPGTVIKNNIVSGSGTAGIRYAGVPSATDVPQAAVPVGKIVNNTVVGNTNSGGDPFGIGIEVADNARPTLLNNIVAETATGISVDASSSATVVGRTHLYRNSDDGTVGQNAIIVSATDPNPPPLFVNSEFDNYYLASGTRAIDRSLGSLPDSSLFVAVKQDLGIPPSDAFSPQRDRFGQLRVDDFSQPPSGLGGESFNDLGAVERADFLGPTATLVDPLDNSVIDLDPQDHDAYVIEPNFLTRLVVQLNDSGIGIDDMFLRSSQWELQRNGVVLNDGVDYTFIYNPASDQVIFQSLTIFAPDNQYTITVVDQSAASGVRDIAGNLLQANRTGNEIRFEVIVDNGVNDPPVNSLPATATTPEDEPLVFRPANNNAITVSDPDAGLGLGTNVLKVTLTPVNGTVVPTTVAGVSSSTSGTVVTLTGTIPLLNQALRGLQFVPDLNYVGTAASLAITTEDNGEFTFGGGGANLSDTDTINITVTPVNDDPTGAGSLTTTSLNDNAGATNLFGGLTVSDVDAGENDLSLTITLTDPTAGTLSGGGFTETGPGTGVYDGDGTNRGGGRHGAR